MFKCPKYLCSNQNCSIVTDDSEKCGESDSFDILYDFKRIYEEKINSIDTGCGDGLEIKIDLQQQWIHDLTEQTHMMVKVVKELENEAIERVHLLEDKLQQSAKCLCEVMKRYNSYDLTLNTDIFQDKSFYLLNDIKNVLEFIRRIRDEGKWSMDGLKFYEIKRKDLFGDEKKITKQTSSSSSSNRPGHCDKSNCPNINKQKNCEGSNCLSSSSKQKHCDPNNCSNLNEEDCNNSNCPNMNKENSCCSSNCSNLKSERFQKLYENPEFQQQKDIINDKEKIIQKLQEENKRLKSFGDPEELFKEIQRFKEKYEQLKQSMDDMRTVLTEEVAYKHDMILMTKRDIQQLEERCIQSDKQMTFKDDIIKELRKEVKQSKKLPRDTPSTSSGKYTDSRDSPRSPSFEPVTDKNNKHQSRTARPGPSNINNDYQTDDFYQDFVKDARQRSSSISPTRKILNDPNDLELSLFEQNSRQSRDQPSTSHNIDKAFDQSGPDDLSLSLYERSPRQSHNQLKTIKNHGKTSERYSRKQSPTRSLSPRRTSPVSIMKETSTKMRENDNAKLQTQQNRGLNTRYERRSELDLHINPIIWGDNTELIDDDETELDSKLDSDKTVMWTTIQTSSTKNFMWKSQLMRRKSISSDREFLNQQITPKVEPINIDEDILNKRTTSKMNPNIYHKKSETEKLRNKCKELEHALACANCRAENLQKAVDLYLNSINLLETTEERARVEIEQQKITIFNLQEALLAIKTELDECKQKNQQDIQDQNCIINRLQTNLKEMENEQDYKQNKFSKMIQFCKKMQDINFELEVENFNNKLDLSIYETRLCKYQTDYKNLEMCKCGQDEDLQKLREQKKYQDEIIKYFKDEMCEMSEQLINLQKVLKYSNKSCKEENEKLISSVLELQKLNDRLLIRLNQSEQKLAYEMQISETKIDELQQIIEQKNCELTLHDVAIEEIRTQLNQALSDNQKLKCTINCLNETLIQQGNEMKLYEKENVENLNCKSQILNYQKGIEDCRADLQKKNKEICKLRNESNKQINLLQKTEKDLKTQMETNQKIECLLRAMEQKLQKSQQDNRQLNDDLQTLCKKCTEIRDNEEQIKRLKEIIFDIKQSLVNLNENELNNKFLSDDFKRSIKMNKDTANELNCDFEFGVLKKILNNLQNTLISQSTLVSESEEKAAKLEQELIQNQMKLKELTEKMHTRQLEEQRLTEHCKCLQNDLKKLRQENQYLKTSKKDLNTTQDEINTLKTEIKKMIDNQICLNTENEKLHQQLQYLKEAEEQIDKMELELKATREINKDLIRQNDDLTNDLQCLHCCYSKLEKKHRYMSDSVRYLEQEVSDLRTNRDDICLESRHVVDNVRIWLEEQRRINAEVNRKNRNYCDIIERLRQEKQNLLNQIKPEQAGKLKNPPETYRKRSPSPLPNRNYHKGQWHLGSQGTDSITDSPTNDSPVSFASCSIDDWYCPAYKDNASDDEYVRKVEGLTAQVKKSNRVWIIEKQNSFCEFTNEK